MSWERQTEQQRQQVEIQQRCTVAIMQAVYAAAGSKAGVDAASSWQMFPSKKPGGGQAEPASADSVSKLIGGPLVPEFSKDEIYALAEQMKGSTGG